jgi:hypothetical protein
MQEYVGREVALGGQGCRSRALRGGELGPDLTRQADRVV